MELDTELELDTKIYFYSMTVCHLNSVYWIALKVHN